MATRIVTVTMAAAQLGISTSAVYRRLNSGRLEEVRLAGKRQGRRYVCLPQS